MLTTFTRCSIRARARLPTSTTSNPSQPPSFFLRYFTNTTRRNVNPPSSSKPLTSKPSTSSRTIPTPTPIQTLRQTQLEKSRSERIQQLASKLLASGRSELYTNTVSRPFVTAATSIFLASLAGVGTIYSTHMWNREETKKLGMPWFVSVGYQAGMIVWGLFAAFALSRTFGLVKSMRLVKTTIATAGAGAGAGKTSERIMLETFVRRPVPFLKPERIVCDPDTLVVNRGKLYAAAMADDMIVAAEGDSFVTKTMRALFYQPFHQTRKAFGGVSLVGVDVGPDGEKRHLIIDAEGQFGRGGQDLLDLSRDEM